MILVLGAPGTEDYGDKFDQWAESWKNACEKGGASFHLITKASGKKSPRDLFRERLVEAAKGDSALWIVLIGHGTFDGRNAKFNLRGPDFSTGDLSGWLDSVDRPVVLVNSAAASAPFISALSGGNRVIVTSTRSGHEQNFARFGGYLSRNVGNHEADLDKDGQTSLLESFLVASREVADFYKKEGRLATEHPLLDDNGDRLGTPPGWFRGIRPVRKAKEGVPDGYRAHQFHLVMSDFERSIPEPLRVERDRLELEVYRLRDRKDELKEETYYRQLEVLLRRIGRIYGQPNSGNKQQ